MEKIVKAKKIHTCYLCQGNIQKGEKYISASCKIGKYDNYPKLKWHIRNCIPKYYLIGTQGMKTMWDNCGRGNHKWIEEEIPGPWYQEDGCMESTGLIICEYCNEYKN
jgi:hypothetical protein